ncbi:MAG TPA: hypothetical protein ENH01_06710 [Nitrospirae bacterium]|nr:hypothetical protein [Nitrospirota bacterium]
MTIDKMVVRFKDKSIMKGRTSDFSLDKTFFHLKLLSGEVVNVDIEKLKAVFHVKSLTGNKNYKCLYKDPILWGGNKVKVQFFDGEVMIGYTPYHISGNKAVLITPADLQCNNKQVFVVTSATKEITFL